MTERNSSSKNGMAVPLTLLFCVIFMTFLFTLSTFRSRVKKQSLASHTQKKAYYMAMGGIQHALLKLRILPRDAYAASSLYRGVCPFFNPRGNSLIATDTTPTNFYPQALEMFRSDLNSASMPWSFKELTSGPHPWRYEVSSFSISSFYTNTDTDLGLTRETATIKVMGYAFDERDSNQDRIEYIEKQVEIKRKI
ncbi:MAG: hypothetical protein HQM10_05700 [Candidatus Riflebacteria bacterium]|nr:hypothetical protein [Candidatus Riflebacteria bacterium]